MTSKMWPFDDQSLSPSDYKHDDTWRKSVSFYFRRPVIYFCFGLPLFAPSLCLILLSSTENNLTPPLVIGSLLLVTATVSVSVGVVLGVRDCRKSRQLKGNQKSSIGLPGISTPESLASDQNGGMSVKIPINKNTSSPSPNSRCSSKSSIKTSTNILLSVDKSKLIHLKRKTGRRKGKRGVRFPTEQLPPLTEEDSFVKSFSRGSTSTSLNVDSTNGSDGNKRRIINTQANRPNASCSNIEELKDYLNVIGLGVVPNDALSKSFGERESFKQNAPPKSFGEREPFKQNAPPKSFGERESFKQNAPPKSFGERESFKQNAPTNHNQHNQMMQSPRIPLTTKSPTQRPNYPEVVTISHERTGIRLP